MSKVITEIFDSLIKSTRILDAKLDRLEAAIEELRTQQSMTARRIDRLAFPMMQTAPPWQPAREEDIHICVEDDLGPFGGPDPVNSDPLEAVPDPAELVKALNALWGNA